MPRSVAAATAAVALALLAGCGGGDDHEAEQIASYRVAVPHASFPAEQRLAAPVELQIAVENTGRRTIPNVTATLATDGRRGSRAGAFVAESDVKGLASRTRPIWIVDEGPLSGDTAFGNTWALGSIAPGRTRTFTWRVVPVRAGRYKLRYLLTGSTSGRSQLRLQDGSLPRGSLPVRVDGKPNQVRVTPDGEIVVLPNS
jgi:hypothetical protein